MSGKNPNTKIQANLQNRKTMAQDQESDSCFFALEEGKNGNHCSLNAASDQPPPQGKTNDEDATIESASVVSKSCPNPAPMPSSLKMISHESLSHNPKSPATKTSLSEARRTVHSKIGLADCAKSLAAGVASLCACACGAIPCLVTTVVFLYGPVILVSVLVLYWKLTVAYGTLDGSEECDATAEYFYWFMTVSVVGSFATLCVTSLNGRRSGSSQENDQPLKILLIWFLRVLGWVAIILGLNAFMLGSSVETCEETNAQYFHAGKTILWFEIIATPCGWVVEFCFLPVATVWLEAHRRYM